MAESLEDLSQAVNELSPAEHGFAHFDPTTTATTTASGEGDLTGWIIPAKDLYHVAGMPTTFGSTRRTSMATETEPFIAAYAARGALIPGKSAVPELGLSVDCEPRGLPAVDNPIFPGHTPGGSSGGAAAMVARGLVRAAHASDGGGSIRVPAAACGIVGFKPSSDNISVQGFLTRSVADTAFLHQLTPTLPKKKLRVGLLTTPLLAETDVQPEWLTAVHEAAEVLTRAGHEVVEVAPWPESAETFERFKDLFTSPMVQLREYDYLAEWLRARGTSVTPEQLNGSRNYAKVLQTRMAEFWGADVILNPTVASDPPPIGAFTSLPPAENFAAQTRWTPWSSLFNISGACAISLPWPVPGRAQPAAVHLGSLTLNDEELLALAQVLER